MHFYCQLDYEHIPYPSPSSPYGNLANNGCGVCCASMVVETLTGQDFPPEESAVLAKSCGAREGFGTDMRIFAPAFAKEKGLNWESTQDPARVLEFLQSGQGVVIGNTAGDREDWTGVFSNSRHYIVVVSAEGNTVRVWDPLLAPGRYDTPGRAGKVRLEGVLMPTQISLWSSVTAAPVPSICSGKHKKKPPYGNIGRFCVCVQDFSIQRYQSFGIRGGMPSIWSKTRL